MFAAEQHEPYARPPLTKALWAGKEESSVFRGTPDLGVEIHTGRRVVGLDLDARSATDDAGTTHTYEAPARDRRHAADAAVRRRRGRLLPHSRRLSAVYARAR